MKEAYYFSHDANARQDEKILMLRAEYGWEGYGIYWALVEMMFESGETALHHSKIKGIAVSYNIDITLLQGVINTCITEQLFSSDGESFWSESLRRRKTKYREMKDKRSEAGKKGMAKRWGKQQKDNVDIENDNNVITDDNGVITKNNKGKESKGKESKGNIYTAEFEEFWSLYPRKLEKKKALTKFKTVRKNHSLETILEGTKKYAQQVKGTESRFIKHPSTFLNNESFVDGYEEQVEQPKPRPIIVEQTESPIAAFWE
jgi:hypothetical protein